METDIRQRLLILNPWLERGDRLAAEIGRRVPAPDRFVRRTVSLGSPDDGRARLVVGPRQAGKSTLAWWSLRDARPHEVLFLNAEEEPVQRWARSAAAMLADLEAELPSVRTVFIDEAQHLDDAGLIVKGLVDARRGLRVLVTGSSAFHLRSRTRETLAGRADRVRLLPLSLGELLEHEPSAVPAVRRARARRMVDRQLVLGSYPGVWFHAEPARLLADLTFALVQRDASDRFRARHLDAFRRLLQLAAGQVGQMVNFSEWASVLGIAAPTVREYVALLEESWILRLLPPFAGGRRREITSAARVHFYDPGLRNSVLGALEPDVARRPDRGALAEAWAFAELCKALPLDWTLHYWRAKGGAEVDFVAAKGERRVGVEVKAGGRLRLGRSGRSFVDAYEPELFILAALDATADAGIGGGPVETQHRGTRVVRCALQDLPTVVRDAL